VNPPKSLEAIKLDSASQRPGIDSRLSEPPLSVTGTDIQSHRQKTEQHHEHDRNHYKHCSLSFTCYRFPLHDAAWQLESSFHDRIPRV
jgi:hypothetical protein